MQNEPPILSLLVAYRNRPVHLKCLLEWFKISSSLEKRIELIIIECSAQPTLKTFRSKKIRYIHVEGDGIFNKSTLLNIGLKESKGKLVTAYDVDLVPIDLSFEIHLKLALKSKAILVSGYRLDYIDEYLNPKEIPLAKFKSTVSRDTYIENFMRLQLVFGQRYGVLPFFERKRIMDIGGWDERFAGWGGEDQDLIERYLGKSRHLVRCPDLIYIHLKHGTSEGWNDKELTLKNNALYNYKRSQAMNDVNDSKQS